MTPPEPGPSKPSAFVPLLLIALALLTIEGGAVIRARARIQALKTQVEQLEFASRQNPQGDAKLESLLSSLLRLAEVDSDAKAIVTKYGLTPPTPSPGTSKYEMAETLRSQSKVETSDASSSSPSPSLAIGEPGATPNRPGQFKTWIGWGLLIAVVGGILCSSIYVRHGGSLHPETDMYLVAHLGDQSFLSKIICPHRADSKFYQHRPLSHLLENLDAHFVYWCYLAGHPHFFSVVTFAFLLGITCLHWHLGVSRLNMDRLTLLLLAALFWTNPNIYLSGMCIRTGKIAVASFVYAGMCGFLARMLRVEGGGSLKIVEPEASKGAVLLYVLLALAACYSDPQGVFIVLLLSGVALAWSAVLKSKEALLASLAGGAACGVHTLYSLSLSPILVRKWSGFEILSASDKVRLHAPPLVYLNKGASLFCDTISFGLGDTPAWVFCPVWLGLLAATFMLRTATATRWASGRLKHPGSFIGITVVALLLANVVMCSVMVAGHPPVAWDDVCRAGYYGLPTVLLWFMVFTGLLGLLLDRFQRSRVLVWVALAVLLAFNLESLPTHYRVTTSGHMQGFIEATPSLLSELKRLSKEPAGKATAEKFDTEKNRRVASVSNVLRDPLNDIRIHGSVDVDAFLKSSRYLNFLRSKKGLDFYQPGQLKTQ